MKWEWQWDFTLCLFTLDRERSRYSLPNMDTWISSHSRNCLEGWGSHWNGGWRLDPDAGTGPTCTCTCTRTSEPRHGEGKGMSFGPFDLPRSLGFVSRAGNLLWKQVTCEHTCSWESAGGPAGCWNGWVSRSSHQPHLEHHVLQLRVFMFREGSSRLRPMRDSWD